MTVVAKFEFAERFHLNVDRRLVGAGLLQLRKWDKSRKKAKKFGLITKPNYRR